MSRYTGGIVTTTEVIPAGNTISAVASGVWTLQEALMYINSGVFPNVANANPTGAFGGGGGSVLARIDFINPNTTGNAADFGDLSVARKALAGVGNRVYGVFVGGEQADGTALNTMDNITWASQGNAVDWGDLTSATTKLAAAGNNVRAVVGGGQVSGSNTNKVEFFNFSSCGNGVDQNDLDSTRS